MGLDLCPYECGNGMIIPAKVNGVSEPIYGENPLHKKSQMDTTCIYIYIYIQYTLPNANFPLKNLCVEPCWAVLFSHHLHVENAHPLLRYNAELLIRKSFWTLPCISWAAHRAINQYPCWHAYVHLAAKKQRNGTGIYPRIVENRWKSSITLIWQFVSNMPSPSELEEHLVLYHSLLLREQKLGSWPQAYSPISPTNLKWSWVSTQGNHMTPASRHRILTQTPPTLKKHMEPKMGLEVKSPFPGVPFYFWFSTRTCLDYTASFAPTTLHHPMYTCI